MTRSSEKLFVTFWHWFFYWEKSKAGYKRVFTNWILFDLIISITITYFIYISPEEIAKNTLLPLCSVFVGVAVSATSIGHSIVTSKEIRELAKHNKGGLEDYVFPFYIAILFLLITICYWGILTLSIIPFDIVLVQYSGIYISVSELSFILGFMLISLSIRLSWQTLISVALFVFASQHIKENLNK